MTAARRIQIIIGLLIALALPFCHLDDLGKEVFGGLGQFSNEVLWWGLFALILVYVIAVERLPISSLGFRRPGALDIVLGVVFALAAVMGIGVIFSVVLPALHLTMTQKINGLF